MFLHVQQYQNMLSESLNVIIKRFIILFNVDAELRTTTSAPPKCIDEKSWCKNVPKKKCGDRIYDFNDEKDDLYKDACKKLCDNC